MDQDEARNDVILVEQTLDQFEIQLTDTGSGVDDTTLESHPEVVTLSRDGTVLTSGQDYFYVYNSTTKVIDLIPATGVWFPGHLYTITLSSAIKDLAGNSIQSNRTDGSTTFNIYLGAGYNFGDAMYVNPTTGKTQPMQSYVPDPNNPGAYILVDATTLSNPPAVVPPAEQVTWPGVSLGNTVGIESNGGTYYVNGKIVNPYDDGVTFPSVGLVSSPNGVMTTETITVDASVAGYLDAFINWQNNGIWDDDGKLSPPPGQFTEYADHVTFLTVNGVAPINGQTPYLSAGLNTLTFQVPAGLVPTGQSSQTVNARFRFHNATSILSTPVTLDSAGEALDGEVEDYQVNLIPYARVGEMRRTSPSIARTSIRSPARTPPRTLMEGPMRGSPTTRRPASPTSTWPRTCSRCPPAAP